MRIYNDKMQEDESMYVYKVGQQVLVKTVNPNKLEPRAIGPFTIQKVYQNGTLDIARSPHVTKRINIRRVIPFRQN